ncbi:MAG: 30S ribosomal protein S6 [Deltaproteobacteria bacterium]|nr:30S ribosomal protein S6 [Deltaproteobacteria bacterium]MBW2141716.1 30S ribosomal protein S6 [Deltaproteobacteria bacterium]
MHQRRYETLFLLHPELSEEEISEIKQKGTGIIEQSQGKLLNLNEWGYRKLAYEIKGQTRGYYFLMDYVGLPDMLSELERQMRIDERVFRYMSLILEKEFNEEKYQQELTRREAEAKKTKEEAEARAAEQKEQAEMAEGSAAAEDAADSVTEAKSADQVEAAANEEAATVAEEPAEEEADTQTEAPSDPESDTDKADPVSA